MKEIDKEKLLQLFLVDKLSCTKIAKLFKVSTATISSRLKRLGVKIVNTQNQSKIDNITKTEIIDLYTSGDKLSVSDIHRQININRTEKIPISSIYKLLHKSKIKIINYQNQTKFDETIFDNINSEEQSYWLGFIFADGYISSRDNTFEISLKYSDVDHLRKFNEFVRYNGDNTKIYPEKHRCRWSVVNKHLWTSLNNLGCTPRKSLTLKFPDFIRNNKDLNIPFIRGYFDGDGCITYDKRRIKPIISIVGTKDFLTSIRDILIENNIESKIQIDKRLNKNLRVLIISKQLDTKAFLDLLYKDAKVYLNRKYKRYEFFKNSHSNEELLEFLAGENGEVCDDNAVVTEGSNKTSEP